MRSDLHDRSARTASNSNPRITRMRQRAKDFIERIQRNNGQLSDPQEIASLQADLAKLQARSIHGLTLQEREDMASLEETISVLQDPKAMEALVEGYRAYLNGDFIEGTDTVKALRQPRRGSQRRYASGAT